MAIPATMSLTQLMNLAGIQLGIMDSGGTFSATQLAEGLQVVNSLIDNKSSDRLMAESALVTSKPLVGGNGTYSIGAGGSINITRPSAIEAATISIGGTGPVMPVKVVNALEWSQIEDRDSGSYLVKFLFYDRGNIGGLGIVRLSPVPLGGTLEIISWSAMTQFPDATTPINIQPAYSRWLILATAIEIAPYYPGAQSPATLIQNYSDATANLRNLNASIFGGEPPAGQTASNVTGQTAIPGVK